MSFDTFLALVLIAGVAAYTPGPNNTLVANAAARFGFARTFPMIAGIGIGFPFMMFCLALGLGALFESSQLFREGMRWAGLIVLLWLAWKIATAPTTLAEQEETRPLRFIEMAGFQWINPKGWAMAISITSQFADPENAIFSALIIAAVFVFMGFSSAAVWAAFGRAIKRFLTSPLRFRIFNYAMAALLLVSVVGLSFADFSA